MADMMTSALSVFVVAFMAMVLVLSFAAGGVWSFFRRRRAEAKAVSALGRIQALEQMLDAAPDGWFAWFPPSCTDSDCSASAEDEGICSRRLAVLLALYAGREAPFSSVLAAFPKAEAQCLEEAVRMLRTRGKEFELTLARRAGDVSALWEDQRIWISGRRTVDAVGVPLVDVLWMRDVGAEQAALEQAIAQCHSLAEEGAHLRQVLDTVPFPLWVRDDDLRLIQVNKAFTQARESTIEKEELAEGQAGRELRALASAARASGEPRSAEFHIVIEGTRRLVGVTEIPVAIRTDASENDGCITVGLAQDITHLEIMRTAMECAISSHTDVLERLGTAIAVFDPDTRLSFHNTAFARLWRLDSDALRRDLPSYAEWLELLRSQRMLPEVADYPAFRQKELGRFASLLQTVEDLQHLPDGKTVRRVLAPHPGGGVLAIYEDVTDYLTLEARLNQGTSVQRETIEVLRDGVAVFGADGRLRLCNPAFKALLGVRESDVTGNPHIVEIATHAVLFSSVLPVWDALRSQLAADPHSCMSRQITLEREDGVWLETRVASLSDGGILLTCFDVTDRIQMENPLQKRHPLTLPKTNLFTVNREYEALQENRA